MTEWGWALTLGGAFGMTEWGWALTLGGAFGMTRNLMRAFRRER